VLPAITALDPASPVLKAFSCYRGLIESAGTAHVAEHGLGGKLLYIGELDEQGRAMTIAGNVAGCAALAVTADPDAQKQAVRVGVVDFLVTSLDEALRILKNEIRKQLTVAVCIAATPGDVEREMLDRGVQPDLTRDDAIHQSGLDFQEPSQERQSATVMWAVEELPARWLPRLDAIALASLQPLDQWSRRWIRHSPRYLGRVASNLRVISADREFATRFTERLRSAVDSHQIGTAATVWVTSEAGPEEYRFHPAQPPSI
jgi:hypothetical protein